MTAFPDEWTEFYRIGIQEKGGSEVEFSGINSEISAMDFGEKDIESTALANGGRVVKKIAMTDESITLKMYQVGTDLSGVGVVQEFHPQDNDDIQSLAADVTADPVAVLNSHGRNKFRIILLWSEKLPAAAATAPDIGQAAYRVQIFNAYMTKYKPDFGDKIMSAEVTFKWAPFDKSGVKNKVEESTDGSAVLVAATAFA